jgi:hypothetical protein
MQPTVSKEDPRRIADEVLISLDGKPGEAIAAALCYALAKFLFFHYNGNIEMAYEAGRISFREALRRCSLSTPAGSNARH